MLLTGHAKEHGQQFCSVLTSSMITAKVDRWWRCRQWQWHSQKFFTRGA